MAITLKTNMGIRKKILLYFSFTTILLTGIVLFFIYTLFAQYRREEFQQRQKEKIKSTLFFLSEAKKADKELTELIGRFKLSELYNEKLLIFNSKKEVIYSSVNDTPVEYSKSILDGLTPTNEWYEGNDGQHDVVGLYFHDKQQAYYGISKAYDTFGFSKLKYLSIILLVSFVVVSISVLMIAYFLSRRITHPLISLTQRISVFDINKAYTPVEVSQSHDEIATLAEQFNTLMKRLNESFSFQKHAVHHISHELKTPISVLVSNFEKMEAESDSKVLKQLITHQKEDTKNLGEIINALLEIAKAETGTIQLNDIIRIDELIFDITDELKNLYPDFQFLVDFSSTQNEKELILQAKSNLLKAAFMNMMVNCILYSDNKKAKITLSYQQNKLHAQFENSGKILSPHEIQFIFQHFFRGENSKNKRGFGLGLVFVSKIIALHGGEVSYQSKDNNVNCFSVALPVQ